MPPHSSWPLPTNQALTANPAQIDVWFVPLTVAPSKLAHFWKDLSADERQRADQFRLDLQRHRFVVARAQLRHVLSRYLPIAAADICFEYEPLGKPRLSENTAGGPVRFNLSKSGDVALIGVTSGRDVGIDVEQVRRVADAENIAERYFSSAESNALLRLPQSERNEAFLRLWTCKEAFLKATGRGLSFPLDQVTICMDGGGEPRIDSTDAGTDDGPWQLASLMPADGYLGAVATPGERHSIEYWRCPD